jgi:hypothetical protein
MNDNVLAKLSTAQHALAECKTVMEAKQIADIAEAARVYLERTQASVETVNQATEVRLLAERQMGEFLKAMPMATGGEYGGMRRTGGDRVVSAPKPPRLADIGITTKKSERVQKLADIPEPEFRARIEEGKTTGRLSTTAILRPQRVRTVFTMGSWERQAKSVMVSWLQAVPEDERAKAAEYLESLPAKILKQISS